MTLRVVISVVVGVAILLLIFSPEKTEHAAKRKSKLVLAIATVGLTIGFVGLARQQQSLDDLNRRICRAVVLITPKIPKGGETDTQALKRIHDANKARAMARSVLGGALSCTNG